MKRYCIYMLMIFTLLLLPQVVSAASLCDYRVLTEERDKARNINVSYSYKMENGEPIFSVTISNLFETMYVKDLLSGKVYHSDDFTSESELILEGYRDDKKISYVVYSKEYGCYGTSLITLYATLPNYNEFSADEVCIGAEEFSLCQRWGAVSVDYDTFVAKVKAYKEQKANPLYPPDFEQEKTWLDYVFAFVGKYYVYLVSLVIIIVLLISALKKIFVQKNEFDFKV